MRFLKQLNILWQSFNHDVRIDEINDKYRLKLTDAESDSKKCDVYRKRFEELGNFSIEIGIATEVYGSRSNAEEYKVEGDKLQNRQRAYITQRHSLFISAISLLFAAFSFIMAIIAVLIAIF